MPSLTLEHIRYIQNERFWKNYYENRKEETKMVVLKKGNITRKTVDPDAVEKYIKQGYSVISNTEAVKAVKPVKPAKKGFDPENMTIDELKDFLTARGVTGLQALRKDDLLQIIEEYI